jgi:hypothetical protein
MIRREDELYPAERPPADFADRVVLAVLRERRTRERHSALLSIASISLTAVGALLCVALEAHRGAERERAAVRELVQEEQAMQARLDAHAEKLTNLLHAADRMADGTRRGAVVPAARDHVSVAGRTAGPPEPRRALAASSCAPGDPLCSGL